MDDDYYSHNEELINDIQIRADSEGIFSEECYFEILNEILTDNGEFRENLYYSPYFSDTELNNKNNNINYKKNIIKADGYYHFNIKNEVNEFFLLIMDYNNSPKVQKFNTDDLKSKLLPAKKFIKECSNPTFMNNVVDTEGFQIAYALCSQFNSITKITIFLATNEEFSGRLKALNTETFLGKKISYQLFDYKRYVELKRSRNGFAPIEINLKEFGFDPIDSLKTFSSTSECDSYLVAVPAELITSIYDAYGSRLLEQNVRTFLGQRPVNKGIIDTIKHEPEMFFAYNNGITATASEIVFDINNTSSNKIVGIKNLQIVNGGQTTATLYYAKNHFNFDLSKIFVQMKLSRIDEKKLSKVVPKISKFANTQNPINKADFFANHPFHINFDQLCKKNPAPKKEEALIATYWFYERARGAYSDKTTNKTPSEKKRFLEKYPKDQVIKKTDLSKILMTFNSLPHIVCKGAQRGFIEFSKTVTEAENFYTDKKKYNTFWYKETIAKTILYNAVDKLIITKKDDWYKGVGSKAVTNTYSIGWLVSYLKTHSLEINLIPIWEKQLISKELYKVFEILTKNIFETILNNDPNNHFSEYGKTLGCWEIVKNKYFEIPSNLIDQISIDSAKLFKKRKEAESIGMDLNITDLYLKLCDLEHDIIDKIIDRSKFYEVITNNELSVYRKIKRKQLIEYDTKTIHKQLLKLNSKISLEEIGVNLVL